MTANGRRNESGKYHVLVLAGVSFAAFLALMHSLHNLALEYCKERPNREIISESLYEFCKLQLLCTTSLVIGIARCAIDMFSGPFLELEHPAIQIAELGHPEAQNTEQIHRHAAA